MLEGKKDSPAISSSERAVETIALATKTTKSGKNRRTTNAMDDLGANIATRLYTVKSVGTSMGSHQIGSQRDLTKARYAKPWLKRNQVLLVNW